MIEYRVRLTNTHNGYFLADMPEFPAFTIGLTPMEAVAKLAEVVAEMSQALTLRGLPIAP